MTTRINPEDQADVICNKFMPYIAWPVIGGAMTAILSTHDTAVCSGNGMGCILLDSVVKSSITTSILAMSAIHDLRQLPVHSRFQFLAAIFAGVEGLSFSFIAHEKSANVYVKALSNLAATLGVFLLYTGPLLVREMNRRQPQHLSI